MNVEDFSESFRFTLCSGVIGMFVMDNLSESDLKEANKLFIALYKTLPLEKKKIIRRFQGSFQTLPSHILEEIKDLFLDNT